MSPLPSTAANAAGFRLAIHCPKAYALGINHGLHGKELFGNG